MTDIDKKHTQKIAAVSPDWYLCKLLRDTEYKLKHLNPECVRFFETLTICMEIYKTEAVRRGLFARRQNDKQ